MLKKISNKIIFATSSLIITLVLFLLIFFIDFLKDIHLNIIEREMSEKINFIELFFKRNRVIVASINSNNINKYTNDISEIINLRITIVNFDGTVIADSEVDNEREMDNHRYRQEILDAVKHGHGKSIRFSNTLKTDMLYYAKKSENSVVRLAKPLQEITETLAKLKKVIILSCIIAILSSFLIIIYISRKITRPINETLSFARNFSTGDFSKRILNYSDDEIGNLQMSLNTLADIIVDKINNLDLEKKKLELTIESIHDGIAVIDNNRRLVLSNNAFNEILQILSPGINRLYYESIRSSYLNDKIEKSLKSGKEGNYKDEKINGRTCELFINPIKDTDTIQGILIIIYDVTEKKRIEQIKTDLVGNMSHELKTPVTILKGYIETMLSNIDNSEMLNDFLKKALMNVDRQNSIITDILKLHRLDTYGEIHEEKIDLNDIILNCIEILSSKAEKKNIKFIKPDPLNIDMVQGNRFLAEEIFFNLIDNAINYNMPDGNIKLEFKRTDEFITIDISDTGIGIPENSIGRIFERFYRVDKSRSRATGGTGLGLSIVKHAAEIMGWSIRAISNGNGATFSIKIPCRKN